MAIIADTGGVLVLLDRHHPKHQATLESLDERLIIPSLILPEVDYLSSRLPRGQNSSFKISISRGSIPLPQALLHLACFA
jgi:hypothetical protein